MKAMLLSGILLLAVFTAAALTGAEAAPEAKDVPTPYIKFDGSSVTFAGNIPSCH